MLRPGSLPPQRGQSAAAEGRVRDRIEVRTRISFFDQVRSCSTSPQLSPPGEGESFSAVEQAKSRWAGSGLKAKTSRAIDDLPEYAIFVSLSWRRGLG